MGGGRGCKGVPLLPIGELQARAEDAKRRRREARTDGRATEAQVLALQSLGPEELAIVAGVRVAPGVHNALVSRIAHVLKEVGLVSRAREDAVSREVFKRVVGTNNLEARAAAADTNRLSFTRQMNLRAALAWLTSRGHPP